MKSERQKFNNICPRRQTWLIATTGLKNSRYGFVYSQRSGREITFRGLEAGNKRQHQIKKKMQEFGQILRDKEEGQKEAWE